MKKGRHGTVEKGPVKGYNPCQGQEKRKEQHDLGPYPPEARNLVRTDFRNFICRLSQVSGDQAF